MPIQKQSPTRLVSPDSTQDLRTDCACGGYGAVGSPGLARGVQPDGETRIGIDAPAPAVRSTSANEMVSSDARGLDTPMAIDLTSPGAFSE